MTTPRPLADLFPPSTESDWRAAVARARKGAVRPLESAILLQRRADAPRVSRHDLEQPWVAIARIAANTPDAAVEEIRLALEAGATGLEIVAADSIHPLGGGIQTASVPAIVNEVAPEVAVRIDADPEVVALVQRQRAGTTTSARDPIARLACGIDAGSAVGASTADGRPWHAGGARNEQELAVVLATAVHHLRHGAADLTCTLVADVDQFRTIAKFRAIRLLLARVAEVSGLALPVSIHAETVWRSLSARDPHVNILRAGSAALGAAVGGADSVAVLPFDALAGGSVHAHRLAVTTQTILAQEAYLSRVADPAAGSGAIEAETEALATAAWSAFQGIEASGGIVESIRTGTLLSEIAAARDQRLADAAASRTKMIGVNAYGAGPGEAREVAPAPARSLVYRRLAEPFE